MRFEAVKNAYGEMKKSVQEKWAGFTKKFEGTKTAMSQEVMKAETPEDLIALGKRLQEQGEALKSEKEGVRTAEAGGEQEHAVREAEAFDADYAEAETMNQEFDRKAAEQKKKDDAKAIEILATLKGNQGSGGGIDAMAAEQNLVEAKMTQTTIETMDDLKVGMSIMVDDSLGRIVKGKVVGINTDYKYVSVEFPVKKSRPDKGDYVENYAVRLSLEDPKVLDYLKQLNNVPEAPWNRYSVDQEVKIPRSSGAVTLARIESFNPKGEVFVRWTENGRGMSKTLPISDIDKLNAQVQTEEKVVHDEKPIEERLEAPKTEMFEKFGEEMRVAAKELVSVVKELDASDKKGKSLEYQSPAWKKAVGEYNVLNDKRNKLREKATWNTEILRKQKSGESYSSYHNYQGETLEAYKRTAMQDPQVVMSLAKAGELGGGYRENEGIGQVSRELRSNPEFMAKLLQNLPDSNAAEGFWPHVTGAAVSRDLYIAAVQKNRLNYQFGPKEWKLDPEVQKVALANGLDRTYLQN